MKTAKGLLAVVLAVGIVLGVPGQAVGNLADQISYIGHLVDESLYGPDHVHDWETGSYGDGTAGPYSIGAAGDTTSVTIPKTVIQSNTSYPQYASTEVGDEYVATAGGSATPDWIKEMAEGVDEQNTAVDGRQDDTADMQPNGANSQPNGAISQFADTVADAIRDWGAGGVTTAYASDSTQDGDNQQGVAGNDTDEYNKAIPGAFGCWRIYLAKFEDGTVVSKTTDVGPMNWPAENGAKESFGSGVKIAQGSLQSGMYTGRSVYFSDIPSLSTPASGLKEFWEKENYTAFKACMPHTGWTESDLEKYIAGEYVIVMEPVAWFMFGGIWFALSATEIGVLDAGMAGLIKKRMGTFTHYEIPGYAWLETNDWKASWGIGAGAPFSGMLSNDAIISTYGISIVYTNQNMCCAHSATDCACYKNANPPNTNPKEDPKKCKCFETHLKDPTNPIPCGPGVPDCDCYPPQCCEHPPTCPCGPGQYPRPDPQTPPCNCPDTHPGTPCSPDEPECDCFTHTPTGLIIHEDEILQTMGAKMEAKGVKFNVQSMPDFSPLSASGINDIDDCYYNCTGHGTDDDGYEEYCSSHYCGHRNGSWTNHSFSASMVFGNATVTFNKDTYTNRTLMQVNQPIDQYKITGLLTGDLDVKYDNAQIKNAHVLNGRNGNTSTGPFDAANVLYFIGHRQGANLAPIPIAAYMGATGYNQAYKNFINPRISYKDKYPNIPGYQFMEGFEGLTNSGAGSYNFTVKYNGSLRNSTSSNPYTVKQPIDGNHSKTITATQTFSTPNSARSYSSRGCTLGKSTSWHYPTCCSGIASAASAYQGNYPGSVSIPQVDYTWTVTVEGTVVSSPKANAPLSQKESFGMQYNQDDVYLIQSPIPSWKFYPTFKMTADYTPGVQSNNPVWVLAAGERTFNAYDALRIEHRSLNVYMSAPWSRDYEDKQQSFNVAKAGMAYKASSQKNIIQCDAWVTVIDPNFVHPNQRDAIISDNNRRIEEYAKAIETIIAAPETNWGMYTNMRAGSSPEAAYVVPFVSSDKNQEEKVKTTMRRTTRGYGHSGLSFNAYRTDGNVKGRDSVVQQSYGYRGFTYTNASVGIPESWDSMTKAQSNMNELLVNTSGKSWYNEDYEGVIVVHITGTAYLNNGAETEYTSIYRHESDWQTALNANSKPLVNQYAQLYKIPAGKYGVGVDFKVPTFSVGGKTVAGLNVGSRIYEFGIRGNVFDDT